MFLKKYSLPLLLLFFALLASFRLFRPGYFSMQDDTQIFRLWQYDQCLKDGQIPCRLISEGGLGYTYSLYNFYPPLAYALAETFHLFGFSFINSIKLVFILCHFLATLGMFLFARLFMDKKSALLSSLLYTLAPYRAVDSYVRGAISELLSLSLLPFVFFFVTKYLRQANKKNLFLSVLFLSSLFLTHNLFSLLTLAALLLYIFIYHQKTPSKIPKSLIPFPLSLAISAFFLLPAFFEKSFTTIHTMTQGYFNYEAHFATLKQLFFSHDWGYGASLWGPVDDLSFQVGYFHWILPLIFFILLLFFKKKKTKNTPIFLFFFALALLSLFLTHQRSIFIWQLFPMMAYFQFPWRFLGPALFSLSFLGGAILTYFPAKKNIFFLVLTLAIIGLNLNYFKQDIWYPNLTDSDKLNQSEVARQSGAGLKDYWPAYGSDFPTDFAPQVPYSSDDINVNSYQKQSNLISSSLTVHSTSALVTFPVAYFPGWKAYNQNQTVRQFGLDDKLGLIQFDLPQGNHQITLQFTNTPLRNFSNSLSFLTILLFSLYLLKKNKT